MTRTTQPTCSASASATSSERAHGPRRGSRALLWVAFAAALGARASPAPRPEAPPSAEHQSAGKIFLSAEEALALAFPKCELARATVYLTEAQVARAKELSGVEVESAIVRPWTATREGKRIGTAYLDTHKVRTLPESILVVVDPQGRVARIELLAFAEPLEYIPRGNWYGQFAGKKLGPELSLRGSIRPVSGASLTAVATTNAVRRVLALHAVLDAQLPGPVQQQGVANRARHP